jgi:transporter family protein
MEAILLAIFTAICWGTSAIFEKMGLLNIDPITAVFIRSLTVIFIIIILFPLFYPGFFKSVINIDKRSLILIIIGGILASFLGQWIYFKALKIGEASRIVPVVTTYPLITLILSIIYLKEELTLFKVLGITLIIIGVCLIRL